MKTSTKIVVGLLLIVAFILLGLTLLMEGIRVGKTEALAIHIGVWIECYIRENQSFPTSEADLEQKGFLKKSQTDAGTRYFGRYSSEEKTPWDWNDLSGFELFTILYGASLENIEIVDGRLCQKSSKKEVLLVRGPYEKRLKPTYQTISLAWYKLIVEEAQRAGESPWPEDAKQ